MRIRTIKPEFWQHEIMAGLSEFARLLAIALLNYADDEGYFLASPQSIRGGVFPFMEDSRNIHGALTELSRIGYIRLGKLEDGRAVGQIVKFREHQVINRPQASKFKGSSTFTEDSVNNHRAFTEDSVSVHGAFSGGMEGNGKGMEQGMERKRRDVGRVASLTPPASDDDSWIASLESTPAYQGINIRAELSKMQQWCQVNNKQPSRRRFINWLNRAERPMDARGSKSQPKHAAYNASTATQGMTSDQIGLFTPDQQ